MSEITTQSSARLEVVDLFGDIQMRRAGDLGVGGARDDVLRGGRIAKVVEELLHTLDRIKPHLDISNTRKKKEYDLL